MSAPSFLTALLSEYTSSEPPTERPHVTLTFAQSIDAKIGDAHNRQLILSGKESMIMTHWMRTMHDGILIGIGTASKDNPQLNVRHLPTSAQPHHLPRPIVIDTHLRLSPTCKLLKNFGAGTGRRPWIICSHDAAIDNAKVKQSLEDAGARILHLPPTAGDVGKDSSVSNALGIPSILRVLRENGIKSLMVEGGAQVITSFLKEHAAPIIDKLIITIAPILVGNEGVAYACPTLISSHGEHRQRFRQACTATIGKDIVVAFDAVSSLSS